MEDRVTKMEETIAHLTRIVDDLSDVMAQQEKEITTLNRRMAMIMQKEAEREVAEGGTVPLADQRPPHW